MKELLSIGVWAFWSKVAQHYGLGNLSILYGFGGYVYSASSSGIRLVEADVSILSLGEKVVRESGSGFLYEVPVQWHIERPSLMVHFVAKEKLEGSLIYDWVEATKSRLFLEARSMGTYPSFLPFFHPIESFTDDLNKALLRSKGVFFLNGQRGTGKRLFCDLHSLLHYNARPADSAVIPELALLEGSQQNEVLSSIQSSPYSPLYICSSYDPMVLAQKKIISRELAHALEPSRVLFRSLERNSLAYDSIRDFYAAFKVQEMPPQGAVNVDALLSAGFLERRVLLPREQLRDFVAKMETRAIEEAMLEVGLSQHRIARRLGISRGSLQHKLKKYNIPYSEWDKNG